MSSKHIAIIGAGVSGLNLARLLEKDFQVTVYESLDRIGGRVWSDKENGLTLDHGFQVYLAGYPEVSGVLDSLTPHLHNFAPGSFIYHEAKRQWFNVSDPLRAPATLLSTLQAPIGTLADKFKILRLRLGVLPAPKEGMSTYEYLKSSGFSQQIIQNFFVPFFSGIFLERDLSTPASFFVFLYNIFSNCQAALPSGGMKMVPEAIFNQINSSNFEFNTRIDTHSSKSVTVKGKTLKFDHVVSSFPYEKGSTPFYRLTTDYFLVKNFETDGGRYLYLNGQKSPLIDYLAPVSKICPDYCSSSNETLLSVNLLGDKADDYSWQKVQAELQVLFPEVEVQGHIKRFDIKKALPTSPLYSTQGLSDFMGDYTHSPSLNGALASSRLTAEVILGS